MIAYAWDAASARFVRLSLCGLTIGVDDIANFCERYADVIAAAPAVHWCPADPSGRNREMPAAGCCELLLGNGREGVWLIAVESGYERPWVPDEVVVAFSEDEREVLGSFVAYQMTRALSERPCGGGHYRDWKAGWCEGESDMVIHLERESGWTPRPFPDGHVRKPGALSRPTDFFLAPLETRPWNVGANPYIGSHRLGRMRGRWGCGQRRPCGSMGAAAATLFRFGTGRKRVSNLSTCCRPPMPTRCPDWANAFRT